MTVILDSKDLALLDKQIAPNASQVWDFLHAGAKAITAADFVGANEVRVNTMTGFTAADYERNGENSRVALSVAKETLKLTKERWFAYDFDRLDEQENAALTISNAVEEHTRLVAFPEKDKVAVAAIINNATADGLAETYVDATNALATYDDAEQYMIDLGVTGPFIMFASSDYYKALKQDKSTTHTFTTNETVNINGIDRRVNLLDGQVPVQVVAKDRIQSVAGKEVNFLLVPTNAVAPIEKYNTVDLIGADTDRDGYRDTVKGLDYYDALVLPKAKPALYVSLKGEAPVPPEPEI